jgi:hypothetical protein
MANSPTTKRPREEEPEESDSDCFIELSDNDDESQESGSSSTRFTNATKETNLGSWKSGKVATAGSGSRKSSNTYFLA